MAAVPPAPDGGSDRARPPPPRIGDLVDLLSSTDPEIRRIVAERLAEIGPPAVPFLMAAFRARGLGDHLRTLLEIQRLHSDLSLPAGWTEDAWLADLQASLGGREPPGAQVYLRARLAHAARLLSEGHAESAGRIAAALATLEPTHPLAEDARRLQRLAERRAFETRVAMPQAIPAASRTVEGEPVLIRFRLEAVGRYPAILRFGLGGGGLVVDTRIRSIDVLGAEMVERRTATIDLPEEIHVAPGSPWEIEWRLETAMAPEAGVARIFQVAAWCRPLQVLGPRGLTSARVAFPLAEVRTVPEASRHLLDDPVLGFRRALEEGTVAELVHAAVLLEPGERLEVAGLVIDIFPDLDATGQHVGYWLLRFLTGEAIGPDYMAWRRWWANRTRVP